MRNWALYPTFLATAISVVELSRITIVNHNKDLPRTLSELVVAEQKVLSRFRNILLICGVLFAITMFFFIVPRSSYFIPALMFSSLMVGGELLAGVIPARGRNHAFPQNCSSVYGAWYVWISISFLV